MSMRRAAGYRVSSGVQASLSLGLGWCLTVGAATADDSAVARAGRHATVEKSPPSQGLELESGEAASLDRVAFAVEGAESDHGADRHMWGPDRNGPQGPMQVSAAAAADVGGGDLAQLYRRYGSWPDAVAAYNWGPGHLDSWISGGRLFGKFPLAVEIYRTRVLVDSSLGIRRGFVHRQPRRPADAPDNRRPAVERLYAQIMRSCGLFRRREEE